MFFKVNSLTVFYLAAVGFFSLKTVFLNVILILKLIKNFNFLATFIVGLNIFSF